MTPSPIDIPVEACRRLLQIMLRIRRFEERIIDIYPEQEMKTPVHLCIGQEAIAAGVCIHLHEDDYLFTTHRSHGHCLAKGADMESLYAEFYGRASGCCRGKGGSMHPAYPRIGILGTSAIVGGAIPIAVGAALAAVHRGEKRIACVFFGDGASEEGTFHESLNFAALHRLPVLFVCENNLYATNSPIAARQPHPDVHRRANGYGIPGVAVDGNEVEAVYHAAGAAAARARAGQGPTLLECRTYRWRGHVGPECDWEKGCRPQSELLEWMDACPLAAFKDRLIRSGIVDEPGYRRQDQETCRAVQAAQRAARAHPYPDIEELTRHLFFED